MTKFLILGDPTYFLEGEFPKDIEDQIVWSDDSYMEIVECHHEDFKDNLVIIHTIGGIDYYEFLRTKDGKLHYVSDYLTKENIIRGFEKR